MVDEGITVWGLIRERSRIDSQTSSDCMASFL